MSTVELSPASRLTAALAAVQARLPEVRKGETATVPTKTGGSYKYSYADLAAVSKAVLPILGEHGLSWITKPTLNAAGKFVLVYKLKHVGGEEETGEYPLSGSTPQEIGSAITYARRYCLCSVTGVAPESDDDDARAASHRDARAPWDAEQTGDGAEGWYRQRPQRPDREQIIARASAAIAAATTQDGLDVMGRLVTERESEGAISADDAINLRRQIVARLDELFPAGEKQATGELPADMPVTDKQHRRMHALWPKVGLGGQEHRDARLTRTALIVGRDVDSSGDLTAQEADKVIDALDAERRAGKEATA